MSDSLCGTLCQELRPVLHRKPIYMGAERQNSGSITPRNFSPRNTNVRPIPTSRHFFPLPGSSWRRTMYATAPPTIPSSTGRTYQAGLLVRRASAFTPPMVDCLLKPDWRGFGHPCPPGQNPQVRRHRPGARGTLAPTPALPLLGFPAACRAPPPWLVVRPASGRNFAQCLCVPTQCHGNASPALVLRPRPVSGGMKTSVCQALPPP